jgi:hypothetical protein
MQEDEMPPLRLLSPYPESETPAKSPDTLQNDLNCGRTTVGRPPEESLAQMGGAINEWEPTTNSFPGLIFIKTMTPHYIMPMHCTGFEAIVAFAKERPDQSILNTAGTKYAFTP